MGSVGHIRENFWNSTSLQVSFSAFWEKPILAKYLDGWGDLPESPNQFTCKQLLLRHLHVDLKICSGHSQNRRWNRDLFQSFRSAYLKKSLGRPWGLRPCTEQHSSRTMNYRKKQSQTRDHKSQDEHTDNGACVCVCTCISAVVNINPRIVTICFTYTLC